MKNPFRFRWVVQGYNSIGDTTDIRRYWLKSSAQMKAESMNMWAEILGLKHTQVRIVRLP